MKWKVEFQYKPPGHARPYDEVQEDPLQFEGEFCPLPNVGDSVDYKEGDKIVVRKVLTRHFAFSYPDFICVNIVVTDVSPKEMAERLKE